MTAVTVDVPLTNTDEHLGIVPHTTNHGELKPMERMLIRVDTDKDIEGRGEMYVFLSPTATESLIEDDIGPIVAGQSPFEVECLRRQAFAEHMNVDIFLSAVETACWDIAGKALGRSVYELLGGWTASTQSMLQHRSHVADGIRNPDPVSVAFCLGILPPEESRVKAREAPNAGFDVLKTEVGRDW